MSTSGLDLPRKKDKRGSMDISRASVPVVAGPLELPAGQKRVRPPKKLASEAVVNAEVAEKATLNSNVLPAKKRKPEPDTPPSTESTQVAASIGPTPIISGDPDDISTKLRKLTQPFLAPKLTRTGARMEIPMDTVWNLATFSSRTNADALKDFLTYTRVNPKIWQDATGARLQQLCSKVQRKNCTKKKVLLEALEAETKSESALMTLPYTDSRRQSLKTSLPKKRRVEEANAVGEDSDTKVLARSTRVLLLPDGGDDYTDLSSDEEFDIKPSHYKKAIKLLQFVKQCAEEDMEEQIAAPHHTGLKMMRVAVATGNVTPEHMNIKTQSLIRDVIHNKHKMTALKEYDSSKGERKAAKKVARRDWSKLQTRVAELIEGEGIDTRKAAEVAMNKVFGEDANGEASDAEE